MLIICFLTTNLTDLHEKLELVLTRIAMNGHELIMNYGNYMSLTTNLTNLHEKLELVLTRIAMNGHELIMNYGNYMSLTTNLAQSSKGINTNCHEWPRIFHE